MEALLHRRPVVTFGRAEYDCVTNHADKNNIESVLINLDYNETKISIYSRKLFSRYQYIKTKI